MSSTGKHSSKLANQRVLILGGSSGLGFGVAEAAFELGAHLVLCSSNQSKLDAAVARIKEAYPTQAEKQSIIACAADLSDVANLDATLEALLQKATNNGANKLNHIVSSAGDGVVLSPLEKINAQLIYKVMNVRLVAPATMANGVRGRQPLRDWSVITTTCAAIEGLSRGLALDLAPIRVNAVAPGVVDTELFDSLADERDAAMQALANDTLVETLGRPEDLAESYVYLMKDRFVTGSVIESNGGVLLK
ncbi:NAD(P)-binding protein [Penicillium malachiteum]|uniref:NAD(P)-binding protein n=1 Tax=Penicillium malachiteum TaxID=1324776 RepID=UPI0025470EA6|nr:NAD(P)-binding protein [Penicillium malachiteum]KAJ5720584.1 NAD(P)-binding protein [Penicillium malachiteum]